MKPIIGICTNYSSDENVGLITDLGMRSQEWDLIAHDYVKAVEMAGGAPLIIPVTTRAENIEPVLRILDGIIFTGGSDIDPQCYGELVQFKLQGIEPVRDEHEIKLAKMVLADADIPVMGICRGMQLINVVRGGTLYQELGSQRKNEFNHCMEMYPKHYPAHDVTFEDKSFLKSVFGKAAIGVNSLHHQGIKTLAQGFAVTAVAPDGLAEGIELTGDRCIFGVQFHPEMMIDNDPELLKLFEAFVKKCSSK
jgi:putative glutamine amidotransferase